MDRIVSVSFCIKNAYDSLGNCLRKKDSRGVTTYAYNEANQLIKSTSANGNITYSYDGRGNRIQEIPQYDPEYRATEPYFTGHPYDGAANLYYAHNRFYDAQTGQWLSEDPIRNGLNWYAYCGSNPVSYVDPLGLAKAYVVYQPGMLESVGWSPEEETKNIDYLKQGLIDNEQYKPDEVEVVAVNNKTEFINWWNQEMPDSVDTLILQMHGSPEALLFDLDGMKSSMKKDENGDLILTSRDMTAEEIKQKLNYKDINLMVNLCCDSLGEYRANDEWADIVDQDTYEKFYTFQNLLDHQYKGQ